MIRHWQNLYSFILNPEEEIILENITITTTINITCINLYASK